MSDEQRDQTCCPGRDECKRSQPPRLFKMDTGCWAVAMAYTWNDDGTMRISDFHALAEDECQSLRGAFDETQPDSVSNHG